nr:translocation/assembly module TamB domain-containing protein [candidate division Zixibacteria bacterium]
MYENRNITRRFLKGLFWSAMVAAILLILAVTLAILPPGESLIKNRLAAWLSDYTGRAVSIGRLETNLFSRLQIENLEIAGNNDDRDHPLLLLKNLRVKFSLAEIWRRKIVIGTVYLDSAAINLYRDSTGRFNIAFLDTLMNSELTADTVESSSGFSVVPGDISLNNMALNYLDEFLEIQAGIHNVHGHIKKDGTDEYDYRIAIDSLAAVYENLPFLLTDIETGGIIDDSGLTMEMTCAETDSLRLEARAALKFGEQTNVNGDLHLSGRPGSLIRRASEIYQLSSPDHIGDIDLNVAVDGSLQQPELSARLAFSDVSFLNVAASEGLIVSRLEGDTLALDSMNIRTLGGSLAGHGYTVLDSSLATGLWINLNKISLPRLWTAVYKETAPYLGTLTGSLAFEGYGREIESWSVKADLDVLKASYRGQPLPDFYARVNFENGLTSLNVHQENFDITSHIRIRDRFLKGDFAASIKNLEPMAGLFNQPDLIGQLNASGLIDGPLDSPSFDAQINGKGLRYRNFPIDTLVAGMIYKDNVLNIENLSFAGASDSSSGAPFYLESFSGQYGYQGRVSGTIDNPTGNIAIELYQPGYAGWALDSGFLEISLADRQATINKGAMYRDSLVIIPQAEFSLTDLKGHLNIDLQTLKSPSQDTAAISDQITRQVSPIGNISTSFDLSDSLNWTCRGIGENLALDELTGLLHDSLDLKGTAEFVFDMNGLPGRPLGLFRFRAEEINYRGMTFDSATARLRLADNILELNDLQLIGKGQKLSVAAVIPLEFDSAGDLILDDNAIIRGKISASDFQLQALESLLPEGMKPSGRMSLELKWNGTALSPNLWGWCEIHDGQLTPGPEDRPVSRIEIKTTIRDSLISFEKATAVILENPLSIEGFLTVSEWKRLNTSLYFNFSDYGRVRCDGHISADSLDFEASIEHFDLETVLPLMPDIRELSGLVDGQLSVFGPASGPEITGHLGIRDLAFRHVMLDQPLQNGIIAITFIDNNIRLDTLYLSPGGGSIFINGDLVHEQEQVKAINLKAAIDSVRVSRNQQYSIDLTSARLNYTGNDDHYLLDGDIELGESRLTVNFKPQSILPWARSVEQTAPELPAFMDQTRIDIRIRESSRLWVDNNLARIRIHTELGVIGSPIKPNFSGRVTIEEGYLLYLDRKFQVKKGVVFFYDPNRFNPEVDLAAEAKVTNYQALEATAYTIKFSASGQLNELQYGLISEPVLDKTDIISLLTFGVTSGQLIGRDQGTKNALMERAQMLSSQKISGYVSRRLGAVFGLDQVSVEGNLFDFNQSGGPQLIAAKQISGRARVTYTTTVGYLNEQSIRLDYRLTRHFSLEGQTDQLGKSSIGLKYGVKFR